MILGAALLGCGIFLGVYSLGKILSSPDNPLVQARQIKHRISAGRESSPQGSASIVRHYHLSDIGQFQNILEKTSFASELALKLKRANLKYSLSGFLLGFVSAAVLVFTVSQFYVPKPLALLVSGGLMAFPFIYLRMKNQQYLAKFGEHLPDATSIISSALKVGQSIETALENVGRSAPYPISVEFQSVASEMKLGMSLDGALQDLYGRIGSPELKIFITGISIQQELGGNLSEIMENLEKTIRERFALEREIKVLSAQGMMTIWVLMCVPFVFAAIWVTTQKDVLTDFLSSTSGQMMVGVSFILQFIAFLWMRQVVKIKD